MPGWQDDIDSATEGSGESGRCGDVEGIVENGDSANLAGESAQGGKTILTVQQRVVVKEEGVEVLRVLRKLETGPTDRTLLLG